MTGPSSAPPPKFHTTRDLSRPTLGGRQSQFGRIWLKSPFMPWQQDLADVAGELLPDGTLAYPLVVVTVQRQAGKSHLSLSQTGERCFSRPRFRAWYTAQTGGDARDQFLKFQDELVVGAPLERVVRTLRGNGHEEMKFPNGSSLRPHPPTETALHGKQSDRNDVDEAWAFTEDEGKLLMQAIAPTQLTRRGAQTWVWSAGGTASSTWLASLVARGRAGEPGLCYVEYGIPDDLPLDDLEAIAQHHPAYGHTVTLESIRNLRANLPDDAEFARAAGNRWTEVIGGGISGPEWESVAWADPIPDTAPVAFGAARAADGSETVLAAAGLVDGHPVVELVVQLPSHGAAAVLKELAGDDGVTVDGSGSGATLADDLALVGAKTRVLTGRETVAACGRLTDAIAHRAIGIRRHPALDAAAAVAARRSVGDGGFVWARTGATASTAALEAATWAAYALVHKPAPERLDVRFA